ncbi:MAG: ABC transporter substrate-binding protein [Myxococcota bacterium]
MTLGRRLAEMRPSRPKGRRGRLGIGWLALPVALLALGAARFVEPDDPDAYMAPPRAVAEKTLDQVLHVLNQREMSSAARIAEIEKIVFDVFDFSTMSKLVLARNWKKFSDPQRREFVGEFKLYLSRTYGARINRYEQTDIEVYGSRIEPRGDVTVLSRAVGGQFDDIEMNYRMRLRKGQWKVIDIIIEGVSMISNFRSQFGEIISRGGPQKLFEQMRAKNARGAGVDSEDD